MSVERGPRPGTKVDRLYQAFKSGVPRIEVVKELGLNRRARTTLTGWLEKRHISEEESADFIQWRRAARVERPKKSYHTEEFRYNLSRKKGETLIKCYPLFLRGLPTESIVQITGLSRSKVSACLGRCRRGGFVNRPQTSEERAEIHRIAHPVGVSRDSGDKKHGKRIYTAQEMNAFVFARSLQEAGFITTDLTNWQRLHQLYDLHRRKLPDSFADKLRLEVFLRARMMVQEGDKSLLMTYDSLGDQINEQWFNTTLIGEQIFIRDALSVNNHNGNYNGQEAIVRIGRTLATHGEVKPGEVSG